MAEITFTKTSLERSKKEYHGKFVHTLGRIQNISITRIMELFYIVCHLVTQTVASNFSVFQGLKRCTQSVSTNPSKPILYPSKYYDVSNVIIFAWIGDQV